MKRATRFVSILVSFVILAIVVYGLFGEFNDNILPADDREYNFVSSENYVKPIGRSYFDGYKRYFSYSGSGIEFSFSGQYVELSLFCDEIETLSYSQYPRYAVFRNGEKIEEAVIDTPEKVVRIDSGGTDASDVVTLIKQSEAKCSTFGIGNIKLFGKNYSMPTAKKDLSIEFIGDSITCGYGIDETDPYGGFSTHTESFTGTYAYLTAKNLDADFSAVCFSGYGVVTGYTNGSAKYPDSVVSKHYFDSAFLADKTKPYWDFSQKENDIVVLNLGANDSIYCSRSSLRQLEFIEAYKAFLKTIRAANPKAYILCVLGDVNNSMFTYIERAVSEYSAETLDFAVGTHTIVFDMGNNDVVVDGHPGPLSNIAASYSLTSKINELIISKKIGVEND